MSMSLPIRPSQAKFHCAIQLAN